MQRWWDIFAAKVQPRLTKDCTGICAHLASMSISASPAASLPAAAPPATQVVGAVPSPEAGSSRRQWEAGQVDYTGGDAFENIQKKLDKKINGD